MLLETKRARSAVSPDSSILDSNVLDASDVEIEQPRKRIALQVGAVCL